MSEWEKRRLDLIAMLEGMDWNDPLAHAFSGVELLSMARMLRHDYGLHAQQTHEEIWADTGSVNPDSGSDPSAAD